MQSEITQRAPSSEIGYAQCWEDGDVLLEALDVRPGHVCLSIASAGDNALALLARAPKRVQAIDFNPAQIACLELRVAAYAELRHAELLELLGSRPSARRTQLYARCRKRLSSEARRFWDARRPQLETGAGAAGRFERYLGLFRDRLLPLAHPRERIAQLLRGGPRTERERFYVREWNTWRWRALFRGFFSRFVMARLGRRPEFFRHVEGDVAGPVLARTRHALTALDPAENPYLEWILTGRHERALPFALRAENFEAIRANLDRLEWRCISLEEYLEEAGTEAFDRCNLSDVFEYMSPQHFERALGRLARSLRRGARIAYWNMLVPRRRPETLSKALRPLHALAAELHARDKAFFYGEFVVEEAP